MTDWLDALCDVAGNDASDSSSSTTDSGWEAVLESLTLASQQETLATDLADAIRTDSDAEHQSEDEEFGSIRAADQGLWWVRLLKKHLGNRWPKQWQSIRLLSGCSGSLTEAAVLQAPFFSRVS